MVTKVKIYMEGGGDGKNSKAMLREGMSKFLANPSKFQVICCGSRNEAFKMFTHAINSQDVNANHIFLLVDSEAFVQDADDSIKRPKQHLRTRDPSWQMHYIPESQIHFMAQVMESWMIADIESLAGFYGQQFNHNAISRNNNVEEINKLQVGIFLEEATRRTQKGKYHKILHGSQILGIINSEVVRQRASYCDRFLRAILLDST